MGKWIATFAEERPRLAVFGWLGLFVLLTGVVIVAPAFVSLPVAVLVAGAWCWWLEETAALTPAPAP